MHYILELELEKLKNGPKFLKGLELNLKNYRENKNIYNVTLHKSLGILNFIFHELCI